ncbi:hypothetical protein C9374_008733 [Naegleria lovaniensis]|uniref:Uncharacterized protein n=1 Tax=Naegleria lovaniensis TaxID=51637 RepID=A0AA88GKG9_NAELO|nr:uncharacterized protein C9374_008733 [Naegleria lovaniensis]KAG2378111.1 hypothetical protein C9374_008733 [Naegleria lovaniensis]
MFRAEPQQNYLCTRKVRERSYKKHRDALASIKPSIDTTAPKDYPHLRTNAKKKQMQKERGDQIGKDNRILVDKMTEIMGKHYLDNKNQNYKFIGSLNSDLRKREAKKITEENSAILKRIQNRQPVYNHLHWEQEWTKSRKWMADKSGNLQPVNQGSFTSLNRSKDNIKGMEVVEENEAFSDDEENYREHDFEEFENNDTSITSETKPENNKQDENGKQEVPSRNVDEGGNSVSPIPVLDSSSTKQEMTTTATNDSSQATPAPPQPTEHETGEGDTSFNASFSYDEEASNTEAPQH